MKKHILLIAFLLLVNTLFANNITKIFNKGKKKSDYPVFYPTFNTIGNLYNNSQQGSYILYVNCFNVPPITQLPEISLEGYEGTWTAPYLTSGTILNIDYTKNNLKQVYYFTPSFRPDIELDLRVVILIVSRINEPQFADYFSTICTTSVVPLLPTTSGNNIAGSWNPSTISSTVAGNYIFTPSDPCGFPYTVSVSFRPVQDCNCGAFLSLETPEINSSKIYENILIKTSNNYSVSGNKTIQLISPLHYIELLPNSSIESQTFFETLLGFNSCFQDQRPANTNLNIRDNDELKNNNIRLTVAPNPSSSTIEVMLNNATFNKVMITSIDGKTMLAAPVTNNESFQVDVSTYAKGLYIVSVIDKEGKVYNQKLIKN